ncbi:hypothetical protein HPP92_000238 [Vanilla planifolia]|uniref:Uncharacterized protein n=1 Tax=Vanilla planifolia TaxID=51239 RepID=A0A835RXM6_VANPL|nr:hypothetical protein HPP92_000224 [Vanilla planifolia]KAG0500166.1 hypothetical protein HPP92_000238 [Vanilla planifolia]
MHLLFSSRRRRHSFIRHRRYRHRGEVFVPRREEFGGRRIIDISPLESEEGLGQFMRLPRSMKDGDIAYFSEMVLPAHAAPRLTPRPSSLTAISSLDLMRTPST